MEAEVKKLPLIVVWFSCGAASAVAAKKTIELYGSTHRIMIVNNLVKEEDSDNYRFLLDIQKWLGQEIFFATNPKYPDNSAVSVWADKKYMSGIKGAPCTVQLKKESRYIFEVANKIDWHVLGFTADEKHRHERFIHSERANTLPVLIDLGITKEDCFEILNQAGIQIPRIYKLGYPNANCVGCVKATSPTYWNLVRNTHPEVFQERATQSREIGCKLVRHNKKRIYLDELPQNAKGRQIKSWDCGIFCPSNI